MDSTELRHRGDIKMTWGWAYKRREPIRMGNEQRSNESCATDWESI